MYRCLDCGLEFEYVEVVFETHGLSSPPYERIKLCPGCHSDNYKELKQLYCGCCGIRIPSGSDYCGEECRRIGELMRKREMARQKQFESAGLSIALREVDRYNKEHGTRYSYGQYFSLKEQGCI